MIWIIVSSPKQDATKLRDCGILVIVRLKVAECHSDCFEDSCYEFKKEEKTWKDARNACKEKRGDLVSIETVEEWDFIKGVIQKQSAKTWFIGLEKRAGSWTWVSGRSLTICNWKNYQGAVNGRVARLHKNNRTFLHGKGEKKKYFICETAKGIGENTSQGYCYMPVAIPCKLEYDKKNWTQTCRFSGHYCSMSCTVSACEPSEEFCGQKCAKTFNPLVQQCTDDKHVNSTYNQTCNATKCDLTEGEQNFSTRNTCYCEDDECSKTCSDIKCTQTCRGRENG
ncbi:C-type lectin domain family 17, member A [Stylophora pistillata]|uniref:C-type lectin domain family 17, member A n=1 Tax=Stylophora pistillata TaxID=50429 RepID=A0A2B4R4V6_STYPI|nr:C-type lectin domain family 17, member A [Stylophora pistillata]